MIILATLAAVLVVGFDVASRLGRDRDGSATGPFERSTIAIVVAASIWLGTSWLLALTGLWTAWALAARAVLFAAAALVLIVVRLRGRAISWDHRVRIGASACLLFPLLWFVFILWRGAIVPPLSHDALSYHLPKALLFARSEGFRHLVELDPRQRNIPVNYEVLMTDIILTEKSDRLTEWPSAVFYVAFLVVCGALAERWWRNGRSSAPAAVTLFAASVPVLLLHSGAHKNDLMTAFFMVASLVLFGRWLRAGERWSLLLMMAAMAAAIGTKPQAAALALCMTPFVLHRLVRELRERLQWRVVAVIAVSGILAFSLLGGAVFLSNLVNERAVVGRVGEESVISYGDWANLWEAPYVLLAAPFSARHNALDVPWESSPWFWQRYEIYFSHLGVPFAICAVLVPFAVFRLRRGEGAYERWAVTIASIGAFVLMLPVVFKPHGMYAISLPRYALFIVPVVFGWTVAPLAARSRRAAVALLATGCAFFGFYAIDNAVNDAFAPLDYVLWARQHPGTRQIAFDSGRAASIVDRLAGPRDKIAFDAGYASWIYPAFGAQLTRPVYFIPPGEGPAAIPDDAKWVVVDRAWGIFWGGGENRDLSEARQFLMRGEPAPEELRVRRQLLRDKRFRIAYLQRGTNQIVFERIR